MIRGLAIVGTSIAAGWTAAAVALDQYGGRSAPDGPYDAIAVAGAGVMPGGLPSDALIARTRTAVALYRDGVAPRIAFTGGIGDWGPAESVVARAMAIDAGVPEAVTVIEDRSTSTEENAVELRATLGDVPIVVVTDRYHVLRCERVFGRQFTRADVVGVTSPPVVRIRGAFREVLAVVWYTVHGRM